MTQEFIIRNQDKTLKELFPKAFVKFTGWADTLEPENKKWLMYFKDGSMQYGFNGEGIWIVSKDNYQFNADKETEASDEKVYKSLILEAKKRGLYEATRLRHADCGNVNSGKEKYFAYVTTTSIWNNYGCVYKEGNWGKLLVTMTKTEAEKKFNIAIE